MSLAQVMSLKPKTFRDSIRQSFILYALVPAMLFAILCYMAVYTMLHKSIVADNKKINAAVTSQFERITSAYLSMACEFATLPNTVNCLNNQQANVELSTQLYQYTGSQAIRGQFYLLNAQNEVLLASTTALPHYIKTAANYGIIRKSLANPNDANISIELLNGANKVLTIGKAIYADNQHLGTLVFEIGQQELTDLFWDISAAKILIVDRYGYACWSTDPLLVNRYGKILGEFQGRSGLVSALDTNFYTHYSDVLDGRFQVYTISETGKYDNIFATVGVTLILICILFFGCIYYASGIVADKKTKVIYQIADTMSNACKGDLEKPLVIQSEDEFQQIATSYNQMLRDMKKLIEDNHEIARQNVLTELKQLETQFNPHFIFNTLELIKYMTKIEPRKVEQVIISLSSLLRNSLDNTVSCVPLHEDIEYTKNYLLIQKFRFEEKLEYQFNIEKATRNYIVPKRIIQPIVENALVHGVDADGYCRLNIIARLQGDRLVIVVKDRGVGITEKRMEEIRAILRDQRNNSLHNGLYNVHRRIGLIYGEQYGLEIESSAARGTRVTISLPRDTEIIQNAESTDC